MFDNSAVNAGRQVALDYAKAIAIICMVICHTVLYLSVGFNEDMAFRFADNVLGGPTVAPLLMVCMGIGICYSRRTSPHYLFKRGIKFLLGGYLLNLARGGGFALLGGLLLGWSPAENGIGVDLAELSFYANMIVDIFQFAGCALLFFSLVVWLNINKWVLLAIGIVMHLVGNQFESLDFGNPYVTALAGVVWPTGVKTDVMCVSCFPFVLWAIYPIFGYVYGKILLRVTDVDRFYRYMLPNVGAVSIVYIMIISVMGPHPFSETYYWHSLVNVFFYLSLVMFMISACHVFSAYMPRLVTPAVHCFSHNLTRIYCVSWCLVIWVSLPYQIFVDEKGTCPVYSYVVGIAIFVASWYLQRQSRRLGWF